MTHTEEYTGFPEPHCDVCMDTGRETKRSGKYADGSERIYTVRCSCGQPTQRETERYLEHREEGGF